MSKPKATKPATQPTEVGAAPELCEFWSLNGKYVINPTTTISQLQDDIACLLEGASVIINLVAEGMQCDGDMASEPMKVASLMYAASNIVEMCNNLNAAAIMHPDRKVRA